MSQRLALGLVEHPHCLRPGPSGRAMKGATRHLIRSNRASYKVPLPLRGFVKRSLCKTVSGYFPVMCSVWKDRFEKRCGTISFFTTVLWVSARLPFKLLFCCTRSICFVLRFRKLTNACHSRTKNQKPLHQPLQTQAEIIYPLPMALPFFVFFFARRHFGGEGGVYILKRPLQQFFTPSLFPGPPPPPQPLEGCFQGWGGGLA